MTTVETSAEATIWTNVCRFDQLTRERGVAALIGSTQVAIFRTFDDQIFAISNIDPKMGAAVMSRGIVGTRGETPTVASPLLKQVYSLETGVCLDDDTLRLTCYPVRLVEGAVEVAVTSGVSAA